MNHLNKLVSNELVYGLPKLKFEKEHVCESCQRGKQTRKYFNLKTCVSTSEPLELLHMDLFGPSRTLSLGGNLYALVVVDDFSRYTWTLFLHTKKEAYSEFKKLAKKLQNSCCNNIGAIRSDHGGEFQNEKFISFCNKLGISHKFSAPRTPQQNGVVERKNMSLKELARTILNDFALPKCLWDDAVSTTCYVMNCVLIQPILKKTPYELLNGRKPNVSHLKVFGCKCYILNNDKESLSNLMLNSIKVSFLVTLLIAMLIVFNKKLMTVEESIHVIFYETNKCEQAAAKINTDEDDQNIFLKNLNSNTEIQPVEPSNQPIENLQQEDLPKDWRIPKDLSLDNIIGQIRKGVSSIRNMVDFLQSYCICFKD